MGQAVAVKFRLKFWIKFCTEKWPYGSSSRSYTNLLVGNDSRDDAAVLDIGNGEAIISTTDFFMPIVDDAFDFGRIASANAISDVYAMGGEPIMAIAILGWPLDKLPPEVAGQVLEGARAICREAAFRWLADIVSTPPNQFLAWP